MADDQLRRGLFEARVETEQAPPAEPPAVVEAAPSGPGRGGRRSAYATRDLTEGSIPKNLWFLAWPQIVEGFLNVFDQIADLFWAGRGIGARAIAGIGIAQNYILLLRLGRVGIDTGMRAMIARSVGRGDMELANHVALQAFTINLIMAFFTMIPGIIATTWLLRVLGISDEIVAVAATYMQVQFVASTMQGFRQMTGAALQAAGDTLTPMKATAVARVIDLGLTPFIMFGWLGLPEMGLTGVAVVNTIAGIVSFGINSRGLLMGTSRLKLTFEGYRLDFPLMGRLTKIALPAAVTNMERNIAQIFVLGMVATFGDFALAAWALTRRVETLANLGSQGLGNSTGIIAGQNIGAGKPERAKETVLWALGYVLVLKLLLAGLFFSFPLFFLSIFNQEAELLEVGVTWLRILVVGFFFMGPVQIFLQTYNISGDTLMPMIATLATVWFVEIPLAAVLSGVAQGWSFFGWTPPAVSGLGQFGVAWAVSLAVGTRLFIYVPYFFWGPWMKKRVIEDLGERRMPGMARMAD